MEQIKTIIRGGGDVGDEDEGKWKTGEEKTNEKKEEMKKIMKNKENIYN